MKEPLSNGAAAAAPDAAQRRPAQEALPLAGGGGGGGNPRASPRAAGAPGLHARGSIPRVSEADEAGAGWGARYDDLLQRTAAGAPACCGTACRVLLWYTPLRVGVVQSAATCHSLEE